MARGTLSPSPPNLGKVPEGLSDFVESYFSETVRRLGISSEQVDQQSKEELQISLGAVEDAIQNYQGFGILKLGISSEFNIFVTQGTSSHNFEMGILPLLLERKNHIVKRLSALGGSPVEAEKAIENHSHAFHLVP